MHFLDVKPWRYAGQLSTIFYDKGKHEEIRKRIPRVRLEKEEEMFLSLLLNFRSLRNQLPYPKGQDCEQPSISHLELIIIITTYLGLLIYFTTFLSMLYSTGSNTTNPMWEEIIIPILQIRPVRPRVAN